MQLTTSGGFLTAANATETSTTPHPNMTGLALSSVQIAVLSVSVFFLILLSLDYVIKRNAAQGCRLDSCRRRHADMDSRPQYSSRQTLVGSTCHIDTQVGEPFYVGQPSSYRLPTLEGTGLPRAATPPSRLPSYESVRKKDRQRQIHMMIANRFGLNAAFVMDSPPTYEETIRQSVDLPYDILGPNLDNSFPPRTCSEPEPPSLQNSPVFHV